LALFCKGSYAGSIYYQGSPSDAYVYTLGVGWGAVNTEDCAQ
jgi:hypothetical protein